MPKYYIYIYIPGLELELILFDNIEYIQNIEICKYILKAYMASHVTIQLKPIRPPIPCTLQKGLVASHTMIYQKPYMASHECKDNNICNIPSMFDIVVFQLLWSLDTQCFYHCILYSNQQEMFMI